MTTQQQHKYQSTPQVEDRDDRSSTEVEESLMGDEKQWHVEGLQRRRRSRTSRVCTTMNSWRWLIDTTLLLAIFALVLRQQLREPPRNPYDFGGDITGFEPSFSQQIKKFNPDYDYAPWNISEFITDPAVLARWNALLPKGMGFQWMKTPENYHDLPTPIQWYEGTTVFTTSVTHQLHCLWAVVQTYAGLKSNTTLPDDHHWHMIHCFSYLRQTILCSADTALEGLETTFPDHNGGSDGWDSKHVCKDYSQVKNYLESVRAYDDQQIF